MNEEQTKEYHRNWHKQKSKDPAYIKKRKEYGKKYREEKINKNPEQLRRYREMTNKWRATPSGIFTSLKNRGRHDFTLTKEDFLTWYESQSKKCSYCNLTLEEIRELPPPYNRKNGLIKYSIDRKNNDVGYTLDNITLSCFTCNTIKNNLLTYDEMKKIGKEILEPKLRLLLSKIS